MHVLFICADCYNTELNCHTGDLDDDKIKSYLFLRLQ
jgi:hypothetical protein